ncbi:hypothetical protein G6F68_020913 [Rhizopus microsporus]|uniref:Uncharacterized protein n=1 Tax=Rhizopus delemar TaxID=936053 RepID=A0A9P7C5C0_9FUNG|nr:hypothetical protein G6F68_020913 [Rhizopus microsporus]KAG1536454.1 hypothetical protein G6F50_015061 [Rhizopus delemar]
MPDERQRDPEQRPVAGQPDRGRVGQAQRRQQPGQGAEAGVQQEREHRGGHHLGHRPGQERQPAHQAAQRHLFVQHQRDAQRRGE